MREYSRKISRKLLGEMKVHKKYLVDFGFFKGLFFGSLGGIFLWCVIALIFLYFLGLTN